MLTNESRVDDQDMSVQLERRSSCVLLVDRGWLNDARSFKGDKVGTES